MAFCALIHHHTNSLVDYDTCDPQQPMENLEKAFSIAETELAVPRLLDPEGSLNCIIIILYIVCRC